MKRLLIVYVFFLGGCSTHLGFQFGATGKSATAPSVGPGGSFSSGGVNGRYDDATGSGALLGAGLLGVLFGRGQRGERTPPELDSSRRVNEQDCTKPIDSAANLRCN